MGKLQLGVFEDEVEEYGDDGRGAGVSDIASAVQTAAHAKASGEEPYEVVLDSVRRQMAQSGRWSPHRLDNPTAGDQREAEKLIQGIVQSYQETASVKGFPALDDEERTVQSILDEIFGWGPISAYMQDPNVEEILVNGPGNIWVIDDTGKHQVGVKFRSGAQLVNFINRAAAPKGRKIDRKSPELNVKLRDGSRMHAIMEPLTDNVPIAVTIRRHRLIARTLNDLVTLGTITAPVATLFRWAILGRLNVVISGGTGSGKTNMINALCSEIPSDERVITVEDTQELQLHNIQDWIALVTREASEGVGAITQQDLIRNTLRMRPDRVITGETRGAEVVDILKAANTGHDGQMLTVHANSERDVVARLEELYWEGLPHASISNIRRQVARAFQLIIHLRRIEIAGKTQRLVTGVAEITGRMEGDLPEVVPIFEDKGSGLNWSGVYPKCIETMNDRGGHAFNFREIVAG
jgi:pilus assembly protein CpaF